MKKRPDSSLIFFPEVFSTRIMLLALALTSSLLGVADPLPKSDDAWSKAGESCSKTAPADRVGACGACCLAAAGVPNGQAPNATQLQFYRICDRVCYDRQNNNDPYRARECCRQTYHDFEVNNACPGSGTRCGHICQGRAPANATGCCEIPMYEWSQDARCPAAQTSVDVAACNAIGGGPVGLPVQAPPPRISTTTSTPIEPSAPVPNPMMPPNPQPNQCVNGECRLEVPKMPSN